jgi:hypothetical protein
VATTPWVPEALLAHHTQFLPGHTMLDEGIVAFDRRLEESARRGSGRESWARGLVGMYRQGRDLD